MHLFLVLIAGIINGTFAIPLRFIKQSSHASAWFIFSIVGMIVIPWILFFISMPVSVAIYLNLNAATLVILIIGGILFGLGQFCFAKAISKIGVALSFSINIGLSVLIGTFFAISNKFGVAVLHNPLILTAIILIIIALINYYYLGATKKEISHNYYQISYRAGWLLALFAGFASGMQNITFITALHYATNLEKVNPYWVWPLFLSIASIPMMISFFCSIKMSALSWINISLKNMLVIIFMGLFFTGSLWLYSISLINVSYLSKVIAWPIFMTAIILTSQIWGVLYKEYHLEKNINKIRLVISVSFLIVAIISLSAIL